MKTRKEGSKARLLGLSCMALVLTAFAPGVQGFPLIKDKS